MSDQSIGRTIRACVWGALVGGLAGFALGILTAPEEGTRIRRRLAFQLDRLGSRVASLVNEALEPGTEGEARREGDALVADAEAKAQTIRKDIDALIGEMRQQKKAG
jgi:gas vesicle protein